MAGIKRRDFLKYCIGSAAALDLDVTVSSRLRQALAADQALPAVIWLTGANCSGCSDSLSNLISPTRPSNVADLLVNYISLEFHPDLMTAPGDLALQALNQATAKGFILAVDGGIPTAFGGHTCILWTERGREVTALEVVANLAPKAKAILTVGNCASFGGTPSGTPNPTGMKSVGDVTGRPTINIPGCPAHPDWIVRTVAQILANKAPHFDRKVWPVDIYRPNIHENFPRNGAAEAKRFGLERESLKELGRDGSKTWANCYFRKWNNGTDWCNSANARCLGCTEPGFPNKFSPFHRVEGLSQQGKGRDRDLKPGGNGQNVGGDRATTA